MLHHLLVILQGVEIVIDAVLLLIVVLTIRSPLFYLIQFISWHLQVVGYPLCAVLAYRKCYTQAGDGKWHFPWWAWPWDNREDGVAAKWFRDQNPEWSFPRVVFTWSARRNPVNNLRYVWGVSKIGRPLWRKTWGRHLGGPHGEPASNGWYAQAGWNPSGFPVLSAGRNIHDF